MDKEELTTFITTFKETDDFTGDEEQDEMKNMYFLSNNFNEFFQDLY